MRFASLGSGSRGNATLVRSGDALVMIDCGFTAREAVQRLARLGVAPENLDAVLVTHEHGDHVRGVGPLCRRFGVPVYASGGTLAALAGGRHALDGCRVEALVPGEAVRVGAFSCLPVPVPHDTRQPCQFVLGAARRTLGVLTDLGSLTRAVVEAYSDCDALLLETNHDWQMLVDGPYPVSLKRRVGGPLGHLSNAQAANLLAQGNVDRLQHLVLSHLSEQNNTPARARAAIADVMAHGQERIRVASQADGFDWLELV